MLFTYKNVLRGTMLTLIIFSINVKINDVIFFIFFIKHIKLSNMLSI